MAVISQNPLSSLTAIYDTDAVMLDAAVSHVTRLTATMCTGGNGSSVICQQSVSIERHPVSGHSCISQSNVTWCLLMCHDSVASTEALSLAIMYQNPLSTVTAIYDTDAVMLDAAVSHVTRLTATVCTGGNDISVIYQQSVTIKRQPYVTVNVKKSVVSTMVSSPVHYCNSIRYGIRMQKALMLAVSGTKRHAHYTSVSCTPLASCLSSC